MLGGTLLGYGHLLISLLCCLTEIQLTILSYKYISSCRQTPFQYLQPQHRRTYSNERFSHHQPWPPVSTCHPDLITEPKVKLILHRSPDCPCPWAPEGCTLEPHFTPGASPAENTATALEQFKVVQEKISNTSNKLKDIKTKIVAKLEEAKLEEMTATMETAQVDDKANTNIESNADVNTGTNAKANPNTTSQIAEASTNDANTTKAAPNNKSRYEQKLARLSKDLKTVDAQLTISEHSLTTAREFAEAGRKFNAEATFQLLVNLLEMNEKMDREIPEFRKTALMVKSFSAEYLE